jgi:Tfp pilus assembly PilM family ATPase
MKITTTFRRPVLAVQWDRSTLDYLLAETKGTDVEVTAAGSVAIPDGEESVSPGELLAQQLKQLGVRKADTLVALSRGQVDVIPLELPPADENELPILVENQVARDAGDLADSSVVDFVPLESRDADTCEVFAFAVDNATLKQVKEECEKASLKPLAIVYRPLASVSLLQRMVPRPERTMMLVTLHTQEADLSVVRHGKLLYTRTARLGAVEESSDLAGQLAVEVRRSLAAASLAADADDQHVYLFGSRDESEQLVQDLAEELSLPVTLLDPFTASDQPGLVSGDVGRVAPLLGMVYEHADQSFPVNFLQPKQPPPPPNYVRRGIAYAAMAIVLLGAGGYYLWSEQASKTAELQAMRGSLTKLTRRLEKVKEKAAVVDAIQRWDADNINWLDELYDITRRFPSGEDAMVRRITISPSRGGTSVVDMSVQVRDQDVVTRLGDQMRAAGHDVRSKRVSEQSSSNEYPWRFDTRITLRRRNTDDYLGGEERIAANDNQTPGESQPAVPVAKQTP